MYLKNKKIQLIDNQIIKTMKSTILSILTTVLVTLGITNSTFAATQNNVVVTTLTDISSINKIEVYGNVELYVSDGSADQVKVYNEYYGQSALVQSRNGVLRISSYKNEKLVVWVTANDLRSISAYDNAVVKSFGQLSNIELNVDLHNTASAKLNLDAFNATVTVNDRAKADLSGSANEFTLSHNVASSVNNYNFTSVHFTEKKINFPVDTEMAGI